MKRIKKILKWGWLVIPFGFMAASIHSWIAHHDVMVSYAFGVASSATFGDALRLALRSQRVAEGGSSHHASN